MKNKIEFKKYFNLTLCISIFLIIFFSMLTIFQYKVLQNNTNQKRNSILINLKEKYPQISEFEIMKILNSSNSGESYLKEYGIDIDKESIIIENEKAFLKFIIIDIIILTTSFGLIITLFITYNHK